MTSNEHIETGTLVQCPHCQIPVKHCNLARHLKKVHGNKAISSREETRQIKVPRLEPAKPVEYGGIVGGDWREPEFSRDRLDKRLGVNKINGLNKKAKQEENIFAKIHNMSNRPNIKLLSDNCPICGDSVRIGRLNRHIRKVHPGFIPGQQKKQTRKLVEAKSKPNQTLEKLPDSTIAAAFREAFDHKPDGSQGIGQFRREWDGKFGSYPLHDDYGDESDAD